MNDVIKNLQKNVLRNVYFYLVAFFLVFISVNALLVFKLNLLSLPIIFSLIVMFMGQVFIFTPFSCAYPLYVFSFLSTIAISMLIWMARHTPYEIVYLTSYGIVVALMIASSFIVHWLTRKKIVIIPMVPMFSVFFFGLSIVLSSSQTVSSTTFDGLFLLTLVLFTITSTLGLNIAYRTMVLKRDVGIGDRNKYLRKTKDDLIEYADDDAHADIDLLIYYFSSSLDSFVYGDFDRSFMDAYKIVFDSRGTAFKTIYTLPENKERRKHFTNIRNNLSHARITEKKKEKNKDIQKLKELRKELFSETLDLLKIIRYEFIDAVLKKE